jgi:flagellar basal-body rod protein FlgF
MKLLIPIKGSSQVDNTTYVALSSQVALRRKLDTIANNLANMNTVGFQKEQLQFAEMFKKMKTEGRGTSFVEDVSSYTSFEQGALQETDSSTDLAIEGKGLFAVQTPNGVRYTRDGRFTANNQGQLVMVNTGYPVLDTGNSPLQIPAGSKKISIGHDGTLSADGQPVSRIGLFQAEPFDLEREGNGLYNPKAGITPQASIASKVAQGFIEKSNVNAIQELTQLIDVQRSYEAASNMINSEHDRIKASIEIIAKLG